VDAGDSEKPSAGHGVEASTDSDATLAEAGHTRESTLQEQPEDVVSKDDDEAAESKGDEAVVSKGDEEAVVSKGNEEASGAVIKDVPPPIVPVKETELTEAVGPVKASNEAPAEPQSAA